METATPLSSSITQRISDGLSRLAAAMRSDEWAAAEATGLTPTQLSILSFLAARGHEGFRVKEIAAHLGVSQPTATDSITALERKGHIVKVAAATDKRAVSIQITEDGRKAVQTAGSIQGAAIAAIASLPPREQKDFLLTLVRMIRHLQEADAIPLQRMCATCRYFRPYSHPDAVNPHHCDFVNAAFGGRDFRVDCREHEMADPTTRAATWEAFQNGSAPPPGNEK